MSKTYILVGTENKNATFLMQGSEIEYFEIFQLKNNASQIESLKDVVSAENQYEALKKFKANYPNLSKCAHKSYHETALPI